MSVSQSRDCAHRKTAAKGQGWSLETQGEQPRWEALLVGVYIPAQATLKHCELTFLPRVLVGSTAFEETGLKTQVRGCPRCCSSILGETGDEAKQPLGLGE